MVYFILFVCTNNNIFVPYKIVMNFICGYHACKILIILNYMSNLAMPGKYTSLYYILFWHPQQIILADYVSNCTFIDKMTNLFYFDLWLFIYYVTCEFAVKILPRLDKIYGSATAMTLWIIMKYFILV
jgi:hypothetical protein